MKLPGCGTDHPEQDILRAAASIRGRRQTPHAPVPLGTRLPRCPKCGGVLRGKGKHVCK